jgi:NAD(P)H-dependent FMN reductase
MTGSIVNMKIQIILGSTRQNRLGDKVAQWVLKKSQEQTDIQYELLDLRDWPLPFYDEVMGASMLDGKYSHLEGKKWADKINEADGYIFVTPEYNHGYSAVLKNALDYAYPEWIRKPGAFVSYGAAAGGARAVEQLRQVLVELQMAPTRFGVHIINIWSAFNDKGEFQSNEMYDKQLDILLKDLSWWTTSLKKARAESN